MLNYQRVNPSEKTLRFSPLKPPVPKTSAESEATTDPATSGARPQSVDQKIATETVGWLSEDILATEC